MTETTYAELFVWVVSCRACGELNTVWRIQDSVFDAEATNSDVLAVQVRLTIHAKKLGAPSPLILGEKMLNYTARELIPDICVHCNSYYNHDQRPVRGTSRHMLKYSTALGSRTGEADL